MKGDLERRHFSFKLGISDLAAKGSASAEDFLADARANPLIGGQSQSSRSSLGWALRSLFISYPKRVLCWAKKGYG